MERFVRVSGVAALMPTANVDTDVIMPKQFLKGVDRSGLARGLFHDLRFDAAGAVRPNFVLNRPDMAQTRFLLVGPNFGCGSSREHAVWGMLQYGVRAIVGTSFAGIFADNATNNGLLLVTLGPDELGALAAEAAVAPHRLTIDLERQEIEAASRLFTFKLDPTRRRALMMGLDCIGETLDQADLILGFETGYLAERPWLAPESHG